MSRNYNKKIYPKKTTNDNNNNNTNNNNRITTNPLSLSTSNQRKIAIRRRWDLFRKHHQSTENINSIRQNEENNQDDRNTINNTFELNLGQNANSDNNLTINNRRRNNLSNNIININRNNIINNTIFNHNQNNIRNNESPNSQFRRLGRLNYIGRQDRHLLLTIYNNNLIQNENNNEVIDSHIINTNNIDNNNQINNNQINNNQIDNNQINNNNHINNNHLNNNHINNANNINNTNIIINSNNTELQNDNNNINNNVNNGNNINNNNTINNHFINNKNVDIIEEEKKRDDTDTEICKEENIGIEIKDTVKCYICFEKITKPKMCPHCHRIACEKCLYNWFINLKKDKCGFCRLKSNFYEMISVPFMDAVVNFVDIYFNKRSKIPTIIDKEFLEYCPEHKNELLYYYCLDCGKPYCKTCFVFFGEEKDRHNGHRIIEYEKYKNKSMPLLKKNMEKLESNIRNAEENIKKCLAYKNSYEFERIIGNKFLKKLQEEFNKQIDSIISLIDSQIERLKDYIDEYNKYKKDVEYFYGDIKREKNNNNDKSCESLIIKLSKINQEKYFSSKEVEKFKELSKKIYVNTYQSKVGEFNHENMFLSRGLKMGSGPYELVIDNKQRNEVQISLSIPKEKIIQKHSYQAFIFIRQKGECVQTYDLDEYKEDYNFYYLRKKIPWDYVGQSIFKIKGMLYEFYFE